jgi:hypothetical protein
MRSHGHQLGLFLVIFFSAPHYPFSTCFKYPQFLALRPTSSSSSTSSLSSVASSSSSTTNFFHHEIIHKSTVSGARVGRLHTPHGIVDTPGFVAVATHAALKGVSMQDAEDAGQQMIFCNSYHLMVINNPPLPPSISLSKESTVLKVSCSNDVVSFKNINEYTATTWHGSN